MKEQFKDKNEFYNLLQQKFEKMGFREAINFEQGEQFWQYLNFLREENQHYNITGLDRPSEILSYHFLDSAAIFTDKRINRNNWKHVLDLGSGAGFPGMVYKILYPELPVFFLDSRLKRTIFLQKLVNKISLIETPYSIVHGRAEDYGSQPNYREKYNPVVSRAVAPLNILCEYDLPFVQLGGFMYAYKSQDCENEIESALDAITLLGGKIEDIIEIKVPGIEKLRKIISIKKIQKTPEKYPRRAGRPRKSPL